MEIKDESNFVHLLPMFYSLFSFYIKSKYLKALLYVAIKTNYLPNQLNVFIQKTVVVYRGIS